LSLLENKMMRRMTSRVEELWLNLDISISNLVGSVG